MTMTPHSKSDLNPRSNIDRQLELATGRNVPADAHLNAETQLDAETQQLRDNWLLLCKSLETSSQVLPQHVADRLESSIAAWASSQPLVKPVAKSIAERPAKPWVRQWTVGALTVAALVLAAITFPTGSSRVTSERSSPRQLTQRTSDSTASETVPPSLWDSTAAARFAWDDSFDEHFAMATWQLWTAQSGSTIGDQGKFSAIADQLWLLATEMRTDEELEDVSQQAIP